MVIESWDQIFACPFFPKKGMCPYSYYDHCCSKYFAMYQIQSLVQIVLQIMASNLDSSNLPPVYYLFKHLPICLNHLVWTVRYLYLDSFQPWRLSEAQLPYLFEALLAYLFGSQLAYLYRQLSSCLWEAALPSHFASD